MATNNTYYMNNKNLKRSGVGIEWNADTIKEYLKCKEDPVYFIKTYIKIINIDLGLVPFTLWPFQEEMVRTAINNRFVIAKMPRQVGKCFFKNTIVKVFDKKSGKIYNTTIGKLYGKHKQNDTSSMQDLQSRDERIQLQEISTRNYSGVHKLSDTVERKFIDSIPLTDIDIWTDTGWQPASVIHKTVEYVEWILKTENHELTCADTHIVFLENGSEVYVKDLVPGDKIKTESGSEEVISIIETDRSSHMYDITVDSDDHRFYTNGILSHNTTTVAALLLWYILFNENFKIAILANKEKQSREILSRIQLAFEHIPHWLQQGVVEWNKGNIELENGSKILSSSTSSTAIRGDSFNLIYLDEFAFVPSNMQDEFFASVYPTISSGQTSKVLITSTPNGMNMFYKIWTDSEERRNNYVRVSVHWSDVPGRTAKWREETINNTSERQFSQEFECVDENTLIEVYDVINMISKEITIKDFINSV